MRLAALAAVLALIGCAAPEQVTPAADDGRLTGTLTVFAAASLTDVVAELADGFETTHPGLTVTTGFGASSSLAQQVVAGAPADVLATASPEALALVEGAQGRVLARNRLQIAVPGGNPGGVTGLADLARPELAVALCAPQVPCGAAAAALLEAAGVRARPDTLEQDARAALAKVRLGEVDAALVYRTDVLAADDEVDGVALPEAAGASSEYPVAVLPGARHPQAARAFVEHLLSPEGQRALADAGFDAP